MPNLQETEDLVKNFLDIRLKPVLYKVPAVILYQGKQVKLPSGKTAWKDKGAARIALTQALTFYYLDNELSEELKKTFGTPSDLRKYLEQEEIIEIREFGEKPRSVDIADELGAPDPSNFSGNDLI